jgi:hypothetical protein
MTAWRPAPIRQDEISRDNGGEKHGPGSQPAEPVTIAEPPSAQASARHHRFGDAIKRLFKQVKGALAAKEPAPEPKPRRKRSTGDTGRAFRMLVKKIVRRTARMPVVVPMDGFFWGTFDSLNPYWDWQDGGEHDSFAEQHYPEQNHLSPH